MTTQQNSNVKIKEIAERIKNRREELGLSYQQFADRTSMSKSTLQRYETQQIEKIPLSKLEAIARALEVSPAYLMGWHSLVGDLHPIKLKKFPLLGEIACGEPLYADQDYESHVLASDDINADFALTAKGDSMIGARIQDGDIVFVRAQSMVDDGEIAVVIIGGEATLKRVYYNREKNQLMLSAENPKYRPLTFAEEELESVRILGKAVYFQSKLQ